MQLVHTHALLAEVEREWEVGMRLNQLAEADGSLPGFMGVGAGVCALRLPIVLFGVSLMIVPLSDTVMADLPCHLT